ncbi:MAG: septum formation protein Maf [Paludibacteraceae bacterium]|nr:septum formation protein Maf [Paludibacteraceae bacterium]
MNIILGSQSPRRRELLRGLDIPHTEVCIDADESYPAGLQGGDIPMYISRAKAEAYLRMHMLEDDDLLITSDTIVWLDGEVLGKPRDEQDARRMLRALSGRTHQVYTAVTFAQSGTLTTKVDCTDVTFEPLTETDIDYYVTTYKPLDKAGAYGIQEWIGYIAASRINGSFYTVMGLPTHLVHRYLSNHQVPVNLKY